MRQRHQGVPLPRLDSTLQPHFSSGFPVVKKDSRKGSKVFTHRDGIGKLFLLFLRTVFLSHLLVHSQRYSFTFVCVGRGGPSCVLSSQTGREQSKRKKNFLPRGERSRVRRPSPSFSCSPFFSFFDRPVVRKEEEEDLEGDLFHPSRPILPWEEETHDL